MLPFNKQNKELLRTFLRRINPKMGLANLSSRHGELVDTKVSGSESNFDVAINIDSRLLDMK